ncbi:MAG: DUF4398 domain-containing protein [Pseudomonadota bacterium]|nr:DUF4398 domain-containing protein [Pseudomonadota bacterium]
MARLTLKHGGIAALVLSAGLAGCSSMAPPTTELAQARSDVQNAQSEDADEYAGLALNEAQYKLKQAEKAMQEENYLEAKRLAEKAAADARLAGITARKERTKQALKEVNDSLDTLRSELGLES